MIGFIKAVQRWNWQLVLSIFLYLLLPRIYDSYSIYLVGNAIPDTNSLSIIAQWSFVSLAIEVIQEAMILPLFFFVGQYIRNKKDILNHIKTSIITTCIITTVMAFVLLIFVDNFVSLIGTPPEIQEKTRSYLIIKIFSIPFSILSVAALTFSESLNLKSVILLIAVLKVIVSAISDSIFFGGVTLFL